VAFTPFRAAVTVALWSLETVLLAEAVKVPVVAPEAINTAVGVVRFALLLLMFTPVQPVGALLSVTVQVLEAPATMLAGVHVTELGITDATRLMVAVAELAPRLAVNCAD